jgi:protocatechuate 3,4-dioxygenase beta subunit
MRNQSTFVILTIAAVVAMVGLGVFAMRTTTPVPTLRWEDDDELPIDSAAESAVMVAEASTRDGDSQRIEAEDEPLPEPERQELRLEGRVVDAFGAPVPHANVRLEFGFGRPGGKAFGSRAVKKTVLTDELGRFAFAGSAFRQLRITLVVAHDQFAPARFLRNLGERELVAQIGDLILRRGARLLGRVTTEDGGGISGAAVSVAPPFGTPSPWANDRREVLPETTTDQNGYYVLDCVPPGRWQAHASAPTRQEGRSPSIIGTEGEQVQVGDIRLAPGQALRGIVTDERGTGLGDVAIALRSQPTDRAAPTADSPLGPFNGRFPSRFRGRSDEQGRFFVDHLPAGVFHLTASKDGHLQVELPDVDPSAGMAVTLRMFEGIHIRGSVTDGRSGEPVEDYTLRVDRRRGLQAPDTALRFRGPQHDHSIADPHHADGRFDTDALQEGVYVVHISSPRHAPFRSQEIELRRGAAPVHLAVELERGISVRGLVVDVEGHPVEGATVRLETAARPQDPAGLGFLPPAHRQFPPREAKTDREGRFELPPAASGTFHLTAEADGYSRCRTDALALQGDQPDLRLVLKPPSGIQGFVSGMASYDASQVVVVAMPAMRAGGTFQAHAMTTPAADGSYVLVPLEPGAYYVRACLGNPFRDLMKRLLSADPPAPDVRLEPGESVEWNPPLHVPQVGSLSGSVLQNGRPGHGMWITIEPEAARTSPAADTGLPTGLRTLGALGAVITEDGSFAIQDIDPGSYELIVRASPRRGTLHRESVVIPPRGTAHVAISVTTTSLDGRLVDPLSGSDQRLDGEIRLYPGLTEAPDPTTAGTLDHFTTQVRGGHFHVEALPAGDYLAVVSIAGHEETATFVEVPPGRASTVAIQLPRR